MIDIDVSKIINEIGEPNARFIEDESVIKQRKLSIIFSLSFLFIFLVGVMTFFVLSNKTMAANKTVGAEVETLKGQNDKLIATETLGQEIEKRDQNIITIIKENPNWSFVLEKLENLVPKGVVFSRFEVDSPETMRINGKSPDYTTLSKFVVSMKDSGIFNNVDLNSASLLSNKEDASVEFSISFGSVKKINRENLVNLDTKQELSKPSVVSSGAVPNVENSVSGSLPSDTAPDKSTSGESQGTPGNNSNNISESPNNSGLPNI